MDQEEILGHFYGKVVFDHTPKGWARPFDPDAFRGVKLLEPLVDAATGEVVAKAEDKLTARQARRIAENTKEVLVGRADLLGRYMAEDLVNEETGEIYAEAGEELAEARLAALEEAGITSLPTLAVDQSNGPWIRNTLAVDKNTNRDDALIDIYRVMRPGEPPTPETAEALFRGLFFDGDRYDLSAVGRVKMNMRLGITDAPDTQRVLRKDDLLKTVKTLCDLKDGRGQIDDIDNLGNRRVRSVGELMENQYRIGLLRMERAIRERMGSVDIDTVMPHDLINAKPAAAAVREFFGSSQLSPVHGPDQPAVGSDAQAPPVRAWAGRSDPRARRLRGARRASDALRPHLPDRDAGRPEHRPDQLAGDLRQGQQVRLHRDAVHAGQGRRRAEGRRAICRRWRRSGWSSRRPTRRWTAAAGSPRTWCRCASRATSGW